MHICIHLYIHIDAYPYSHMHVYVCLCVFQIQYPVTAETASSLGSELWYAPVISALPHSIPHILGNRRMLHASKCCGFGLWHPLQLTDGKPVTSHWFIAQKTPLVQNKAVLNSSLSPYLSSLINYGKELNILCFLICSNFIVILRAHNHSLF